jgi:hypothetical protein
MQYFYKQFPASGNNYPASINEAPRRKGYQHRIFFYSPQCLRSVASALLEETGNRKRDLPFEFGEANLSMHPLSVPPMAGFD